MQLLGAKFWSLPAVNQKTLEKVKQACEACASEEADVFFTCLRQHGALGIEVAAVIAVVLPDLADAAVVSIAQLREAITQHLQLAQAA